MTEEIKRIKKRISDLGLKKGHVAQRIGALQSEFSHFLSGRRKLSDAKLKELKDYLNLK